MDGLGGEEGCGEEEERCAVPRLPQLLLRSP